MIKLNLSLFWQTLHHSLCMFLERPMLLRRPAAVCVQRGSPQQHHDGAVQGAVSVPRAAAADGRV